ncbi:MAG: 4-(cytidine 5'-diphospho)-2-C-methyl-D-erythritol kinase [Clostridia bacterium]|nr:4-(cytidine 5'-diphospho)-2-C-methyl-D-erythritol kinase [Clostridia bacterium]
MNKKSVQVKAPAKINLTLNIEEKRTDGYHNVDMIMQAVDLYDIITVTPNDSSDITISSNVQGVPLDESNLVHKAAVGFFEMNPELFGGVHIDIEKHIPMQAGLAGGSTDCAAALLGLNFAYGEPLMLDELMIIGAKLGADVPFCFNGATAYATGIGTTLEKINDMPQCHIILIKPEINVSTKEAYQKSDARTEFYPRASIKMISAINKESFDGVCDALHNDFQQILKIDEVEEIVEALKRVGARNACMSGSGPSVFGLFDNKAVATRAFDELKGRYNNIFLCIPIKSGCEIVINE